MIRYLVSILIIAGVFFSCKKEKSFEAGSPALGSLQDSLGNCLDKTVSGNYVVGKTLTDSNYIDVNVLVQAKGVYSIYTDTVNGYYFKASGSFATTGQNTIRLKGIGKPVSSGTDDFIILFDSTLCPVSVTVTDTASGGTGGGGTGSNSDHFPLTANSYWAYDDITYTDSIKRTNSFLASISGTVYRAFIDSDFTGPLDTFYYRKSGNDYYENNWTDFYSGVPFDVPQRTDIDFLKENIATGQSWTSPDYSGNISGNPTKIHYVFTCSNSNATVSYNGQTYTNVYQVTMKCFISIQGSPFTDEGILITRYFAKGVGMIYERIDNNQSVIDEIQIKYYKVY
jgi:hypothetical protein